MEFVRIEDLATFQTLDELCVVMPGDNTNSWVFAGRCHHFRFQLDWYRVGTFAIRLLQPWIAPVYVSPMFVPGDANRIKADRSHSDSRLARVGLFLEPQFAPVIGAGPAMDGL